ncbi:hypothetical protein [Micromonospora coerulea]|uniref:hypothetical protein n=1 Tax=Micromonospora coerulea TaxID=47856 RepID=UPI001907047D|nr:hypothetical protein [Micromonospora veneta]
MQRFVDDDVAAMPADLFGTVFGPYVDRREPEFGSAHITVPDGGDATFYGVTDVQIDSLMITRFSPGQVLDLLVEFANRAGGVIIPPDCPTMLTVEEQRGVVPEELRSGAVVVASGADVEAVLAAD